LQTHSFPTRRSSDLTLNRNSLPFDPNGPWYTSGLRIGTPAVTTLGMAAHEMAEIAAIIKNVLAATKPEMIAEGDNKGKPGKAKYVLDANVKKQARIRVQELLKKFPVYPQIDLEFLKKYFDPK
jgi:glycine hydroxymethyltransferase